MWILSFKNSNLRIVLSLKLLTVAFIALEALVFNSCQANLNYGPWDYQINFKDRKEDGVLKLHQNNGDY